ncbi:MAG: cob(I)yrinic acid a,c-diamide adenosyltransferase [Muribaculaceae bacterium]|nr:cob(I)yrinic acid a,c-diamide adenosyltransferase [Muribaculaceae bacterium]
MKKVYTRTGDGGTTSIGGDIRVSKADHRIETLGSLDELNVSIGICRSMMNDNPEMLSYLKGIQQSLMKVMSNVALTADMRAERAPEITEEMIKGIEEKIDYITSVTSQPKCYILPGGTPLSSFLHKARVDTRRAERNLWRLNEQDPLPENLLKYVNRLADLFFILSRNELLKHGLVEEHWCLSQDPRCGC